MTKSQAAHNLCHSSLVGGPNGFDTESDGSRHFKEGKENGARSSTYSVRDFVDEISSQNTR